MKYFLFLAILSLGVLVQNIHGQASLQANSNPSTLKPEHQQKQGSLPDSMVQRIEKVQQLNPQILPQDRPTQHSHPRKHQKQHKEHRRPEEHKFLNSAEDRSDQPKDHFGGPAGPRDRLIGQAKQNENFENQRQFREQNQKEFCHKKFGKGRKFAHIAFFIVLAVFSFILIRKCMKKRHDKRRRINQCQRPVNQISIDEQISNHYSEIQRLTELRNAFQQQQEPNQVIYHNIYPQYPQEAEISNMSRGRMINENSYPANQIHQNIPVGRPILNNPYNNPQACRFSQY